MKEWIIRLMCVLLGVVLTIGTLGIRDIVLNEFKVEQKEKEPELVVSVEKPTPTPDEEVVQDYELEADVKYQDMVDKQEAEKAVEPTVEPEEEIEYPANSIEAAPVKWKRDYPAINSDTTLEDKECVRSSYDETMAVNAFDKKIIENSTIDFSDVKISIIGDSITAGNNLDESEREEGNWPAQLQKILGCKEVVNLGIGGSTVSRVVDHYPMCDRWYEINQDSDIIIVMGGSNDMLFENKWQFGELEYERRMTSGTFCGDYDEMLSRMKWTYTDHNDVNYCKLLCINPPSTILNDAVYALDTGNMVHQRSFAEAINTIAPAYGFEVIDMYNNNILNSHDPDVNAQFVYDGIHCNVEGYRIIAEHVASQIIQRIDQE